jgi:hypothetical protein
MAILFHLLSTQEISNYTTTNSSSNTNFTTNSSRIQKMSKVGVAVG